MQSRLTTHQPAWAQVRPARRAGDRELEVVELNFKSACAASESAFSPNRSRRAEKSIPIRLGASLLRQNLFDQLEYRRQVLVLRSGQIEIFLAFFQAVVGIDVVFWNIDAAGIVRVGPAEFL